MFDSRILEVTALDTPLHRLDARTKLFFAASVSTGVLLIDSPVTLYLIFSFVLALHFFARSSYERWQLLMLVVLIGMWGSVVSQSIFYNQLPRTPVFCLLAADENRRLMSEGIYFYREGVRYGALQALRTATMASAGLLLCWTTEQRKLLRGFIYWKMPYELAFMCITSLRFLPDIFGEAQAVLTAQRLRGARPLRRLRPGRLVAALYQLLYPVCARVIKRAGTLALSVEARGFGRNGGARIADPWPGGERLCACLAGVFVLILFCAKVLYWLQFNGIFYHPFWRPVYDLVKLWL